MSYARSAFRRMPLGLAVTLAVFRSARAEWLAAALADQLRAEDRDPFEQVPIVVGSRGMERWLRHQLATHLGIAANLAFPFPRQSLDGLAASLLAGAASRDVPFWQVRAASDEVRWQTDALTFAVLTALRSHLHLPEFATVRTYLQLDGPATSAAVAFRELAFAREVADVLDKLLHDRHTDALLWATDTASAGPHAWLALLLAAVGAQDPQSPAQVRAHLLAQPPVAVPGTATLRLFCLSTLGPSDRQLLAALAERVPVELYLLAPSQAWWADIHSRREHFRALQRAASAEARVEVERERASQNQLLASLGIPSRDVQVWLETLSYDEPAPAPEPQEPTTDLERLQQWIGAAGDTADLAKAGLLGDGSVALHACWGALRQVEVLRDELLQLFQQHPGAIEPRDVLVMTPDIETFAPLVAAVFARRGPFEPAQQQGATSAAGLVDDDDALDARGQPSKTAQLPTIPVSIADLGLVRVNPVAEVLLAVLALTEGRVSAPQLYALLALEPVRLRLGLSVDDVADLRELMDDSGMRWGLDADDRALADQPALRQNTLDFGLERLALGALLADPEPSELWQVAGTDVAPLPVRNGERVARVAALAQLVGAVREARRRQSEHKSGRTLQNWLAEWHTLLTDFVLTSDAAGWLTAQVRGELDAFAKAGADFAGVLSLGAVRRALQGRFDLPVRGDRAITGAVTVCALQPMRSVPFKVIALLGMDDGQFPQARTRRAWDPFSTPKAGEIDPRLAQRHLLLETLLSVRTKLLILWNGYGSKPGEVFAPAVPVVELRDLLVEATGLPRARWVTEHPLQPWSPRAFVGGRFTYAKAVAQAAGVLMQVQAGQRQPLPMGLAATQAAECAPESNPPASLTIEELVKGLRRPYDMFLRDRLQVQMAREQAELQDREPLELGSLDQWSVRDGVMQALLDDADHDRSALAQTLTRRLQAEGRLPLQAGGQLLVEQACDAVGTLFDNYGRALGIVAPGGELLRVDVVVASAGAPRSVRVQGPSLAVRTLGDCALLEWLSPSRSDKAKNLLRTWVYLLSARASGSPALAARVVGHQDEPKKGSKGRPGQIAGKVLATAATPEQATQILTDLVAVWQACRDRPLPLFEETSWAWAQAAAGPPGKVRAAVRSKWYGQDAAHPGDASQPAVRALFAGWDPAEHLDPAEGPESFAGLAARVYGPIVQALQAGAAAAAPFFAPESGDSEDAP